MDKGETPSISAVLPGWFPASNSAQLQLMGEGKRLNYPFHSCTTVRNTLSATEIINESLVHSPWEGLILHTTFMWGEPHGWLLLFFKSRDRNLFCGHFRRQGTGRKHRDQKFLKNAKLSAIAGVTLLLVGGFIFGLKNIRS